MMIAASVANSYGLGSTKTIAPAAPTDHNNARCSDAIAGTGVKEDRELSAAAVYAITHSTQRNKSGANCAGTNSIRVLVPRQQRDRRFQQDVDVEQHRPVLDVIQVELDALLDLLFIVNLAAPAVDLRPAGDAGFYAMASKVTIDGFVEQAALQLALHRMGARTDQ